MCALKIFFKFNVIKFNSFLTSLFKLQVFLFITAPKNDVCKKRDLVCGSCWRIIVFGESCHRE